MGAPDLQYVGTSATLAGAGNYKEQRIEVAKVAVPKTDLNGVQKIDRDTQWPMYTVVLLVLDVVRETAEDLTVSVPSPTMPNLTWREPVSVVDLEMIPWASTGGRGRSTGSAAGCPTCASSVSGRSS